jgi:hypothetical protein
MKATFILKDLSDVFYNGNSGSIAGLNSYSDADKFTYLCKRAAEGALSISTNIGNGSFRDKVDLNSMLKGQFTVSYKLEPRRGYKLATFEINASKL